MAQRLIVYGDLLRVTAKLVDNAMTWSSIPLADLKETDNDELDRVISQARVVASDAVYKHLDELGRSAGDFNRSLFAAKLHHGNVRRQGEVDDGPAIRQRMALGATADKMKLSYQSILASVRAEMRA